MSLLIKGRIGLSTQASDVLRNSNDGMKQTTELAYTKLKEVLLNADLPACRLKFDMSLDVIDTTVYAKVYKNGIAIGVEQTATTTGYVTKSEDFTGFSSGDLIQIYGKGFGARNVRVQNMRFHYTHIVKTLENHVLVTALVTTTDPTISMTNQDP